MENFDWKYTDEEYEEDCEAQDQIFDQFEQYERIKALRSQFTKDTGLEMSDGRAWETYARWLEEMVVSH